MENYLALPSPRDPPCRQAAASVCPAVTLWPHNPVTHRVGRQQHQSALLWPCDPVTPWPTVSAGSSISLLCCDPVTPWPRDPPCRQAAASVCSAVTLWPCDPVTHRVGRQQYQSALLWPCDPVTHRVGRQRHQSALLWPCDPVTHRVGRQRHQSALLWPCDPVTPWPTVSAGSGISLLCCDHVTPWPLDPPCRQAAASVCPAVTLWPRDPVTHRVGRQRHQSALLWPCDPVTPWPTVSAGSSISLLCCDPVTLWPRDPPCRQAAASACRRPLSAGCPLVPSPAASLGRGRCRSPASHTPPARGPTPSAGFPERPPGGATRRSGLWPPLGPRLSGRQRGQTRSAALLAVTVKGTVYTYAGRRDQLLSWLGQSRGQSIHTRADAISCSPGCDSQGDSLYIRGQTRSAALPAVTVKGTVYTYTGRRDQLLSWLGQSRGQSIHTRADAISCFPGCDSQGDSLYIRGQTQSAALPAVTVKGTVYTYTGRRDQLLSWLGQSRGQSIHTRADAISCSPGCEGQGDSLYIRGQTQSAALPAVTVKGTVYTYAGRRNQLLSRLWGSDSDFVYLDQTSTWNAQNINNR